MDIAANQVKMIAKEDLAGFKFSKEDVLKDEVDKRKLRAVYLRKAEALGNAYKGKVKLTFVSADNQLFAVETTVWAASDDYVSLKASVNIPVISILEIEF